MAEFDNEGANLDLLHLKCPGDESADVYTDANAVEDLSVKKDFKRNEIMDSSYLTSKLDTEELVESLNVKKQPESSKILESSNVTSELDNDVLTQTDVDGDMGEECSYKSSVQLNNIENLKKNTEPSTSSSCTVINNIHDACTVEDGHDDSNILQINFINGVAHVVPDSDPEAGCKTKKGVSFPKGTLISGFLDPPDPWKNAPSWTSDELVSVYKRSCDINGTKPIAKLIPQLQAMNSENQREELLSLKGEKLDQKQCDCLEEILKRAQFKLLDLEACHLDDETAVALFDMIEFYESAYQLNIAFNRNIQARGWQACSKLMRRTPNLTFLDLRNCDLNENTIPIFGRALKLGCHVTILHMENMNLSGKPLLILVAAIKSNEVLQELFLAENKLMPTDGVQLGNLLLYNHKLRLLDLRNNHLQDVGTGHICDGLMEQKLGFGLRTLVLWNNSITYQAMSALGRALASSQNLETLNIGHNSITNEGVHQLKDGLLRLNSLLRLGLQGSRISDEGAVAIAEYIAETTVLLRIDLRENDIKTAGLMALSHAMRVNTSVTRVDLDKEAKKEPGIKDYMEQQGRLIGDILTFQQRNVQIAVRKEEQERMLLKEKVETQIAAAQREIENEQHTGGTLPANSSTESFTLIEDVMEKDAEQEINKSDTDIFNAKIVGGKHQEQVSSSEKESNVDALNCLLHEEDKKPQNRPNILPFQGLSPQTSLDSSAPASNDDPFAITLSDLYYECVSPPSHHSETDVPALTGTSAPAEMILSPQYFPKQIARKIFSVIRVSEAPSCPQSSSSTTSPDPMSYDPLSVSPVPLIPVSSSTSLPSSMSGLQSAVDVAHHSKCALQAASPSTLLLQDLAEESMRHMVSPDVDMEIKHLAASNPEPDNSQKAIDKDNNGMNKDFSLENGSFPTLELLNASLELSNCSEAAVSCQTHPMPVSQANTEDCDELEILVAATESGQVSTSTFRKRFGSENCEKQNSSVGDSSITECISLEDAASFQQKLLLSKSTSEKAQHPSTACFTSQELELKQTSTGSCQEISLGNHFVTEDTQDAFKDAFTNNTQTECGHPVLEISLDSPIFSIEDSPESDSNFTDSKNEMAAFLDLGADDDSPHCKGATEKDDLFYQHHLDADEVRENSQRMFLPGEKHSLSSVTDLHTSEEPVSICLNNYSSPSLLVSQELSSASFQEKSVISQFSTTNSEEHPFSSIVDLLRLDMCELSDRRDMQMDTVMASFKASSNDISGELVSVINLVSDNIDIENVDFGVDEEPWLTVGVEIDGNDAEASKKSMKQPDFFTTLSMNGLTQELASALTSLDGSNSPFDGEDYDLDS